MSLPHRYYINIPIITLTQEYNSTKRIFWKFLFRLLELVILKKKKKRILLLSVFPDFIFVNIKRNFNYEKFKKIYIYVLFCFLSWRFWVMVLFSDWLIRVCCVLKWDPISFFFVVFFCFFQYKWFFLEVWYWFMA